MNRSDQIGYSTLATQIYKDGTVFTACETVSRSSDQTDKNVCFATEKSRSTMTRYCVSIMSMLCHLESE